MLIHLSKNLKKARSCWVGGKKVLYDRDTIRELLRAGGATSEEEREEFQSLMKDVNPERLIDLLCVLGKNFWVGKNWKTTKDPKS